MLPQPSPQPRGLPLSPRLRIRTDRVDTPSRPDVPGPSTTSARSWQRTPGPISALTDRSHPRSRSRPPMYESDSPQSLHSRGRVHRFKRSDRSSPSSSSVSSREGPEGYTSSQTSLEDNEGLPKQGRGQQLKIAGSMNYESMDKENDCYESEHKLVSQPETGYSLWNTVVTAASTLTISVSKAWASDVFTAAGEETPLGEESRLTRAMKAYHLEKARDPSDLPDWLFPEIERRYAIRSQSKSCHEGTDMQDEPKSPPPGSRGLRDIYTAAAAASSLATSPTTGAARRVVRNQPDPYADEAIVPSKATDRLKALRDAKRQVLAPGQHGENSTGRIRPPLVTGLPRRPRERQGSDC